MTNNMIVIVTIFTLFNQAFCSPSSYKIISATAWITEPSTYYPDFSASLTPTDFLPSVFQYSFNGSSTVFTCTTRNCSQISMVSMPGLDAARLALGGISPRRIQQRSPIASNAQFFLSTGYATPNRDTELIVCLPTDPRCSKPRIMNTVDSSGFGQAGLRLTFTRPVGLPIMLIPEARYASRDNRVTGYMIEACQDSLCQLVRSHASLPFNLTGKAYCEGTSIDVALNRFGLPSWLTLCGPELNLIHCITSTCNQTLVSQFQVDRNWVYFVYLAVDSQFRFTITTTGQTAQSDITYIRCLDPDCTESRQSQLTIANRPSPTRTPIIRAQVVIDPGTDLPVFHLTGLIYPSNVPVYTFVVCQDIECDMSRAIYVNYGDTRFGLDTMRVSDVFVNDQGTVIASIRTIHVPTNKTISAIVQMALTSQPDVTTLNFVEPTLTFQFTV